MDAFAITEGKELVVTLSADNSSEETLLKLGEHSAPTWVIDEKTGDLVCRIRLTGDC